MIEITIVFLLLCALATLCLLSLIDLQIGLLPNKLVLTFATLGAVFHVFTDFLYASLEDMALGALTGGGLLYAIRIAANWHYKDDTLGLGDIKLLAAAGLWLGPEHVLFALIAGAVAGLLHGLFVALWARFVRKKPLKLARLSIPAGPGFAVGICLGGAMKFSTLPALLLS